MCQHEGTAPALPGSRFLQEGLTLLRRVEYKYLVGVVFVFGLFMDLLDMTITNVALPTLQREFHAPTTTIEWVVTGYLLSLAIFIPVSGWAATASAPGAFSSSRWRCSPPAHSSAAFRRASAS